MIPIAHGGSGLAYRADVVDAHASPLGNEYFAVMTPGDRDQFVFMQNGEPGGLYCADETDGESLRVCEQMTESLYAYEIAGTAADSTGVKNFFLYRDRRRAAVAEQRRMYVALERQATAFATRYDERLDPAERAMLAAFCTLGGKGFFGRRHLMLKHGFLLSDRWLSFMSMVR